MIPISADYLFSKYKVGIQIRDRILGGVPSTEDVGKIADKLPLNAPIEERQKIAEEKILESACTFLFDDAEGEFYIRDANVIAMLREASSMMQVGYETKQVLQHGLSVKPPRLYLGKKVAEQPLRRPVHVEVRGIKQATVKVNTYIERPYFEFVLWVQKGEGKKKRQKDKDGKTKMVTLPDERLTEAMVKKLFLHGTEVGIGACRAQQWGKYDLMLFEALPDSLEV